MAATFQKKLPRILILPSWFKNKLAPGAGSFFLDQAIALRNEGVDVIIAHNNQVSWRDFFKVPLNEYFSVNEKTISGIPVFQTQSLRLPKSNFKPVAFIMRRLGQLVIQFGWRRVIRHALQTKGSPDLIHAHSFYPGHSLIWAKKKFGIRFVVTEHFSKLSELSFRRAQGPALKNLYQHSNKLLAVSDSLANFLRDISPRAIQVIPNGIFTNQFTIAHKKADEFTFIAIGNFVPIKGFENLIRAFTDAFKGEAQVKLILVGDGVLLEDMRALVLKLGMQLQIQFLGRIDGPAKAKILSESHVLVSASEYETFGITLIEALACGVPVLSVNTGGRIETINHKDLGLLTPGDRQSLASAMRKIMKDYNFKFNPTNIRKYAVERYDYQNIAKQLIEIYKESISNQRLKIAILAPLNSVHTQKWITALADLGHEIDVISMHRCEDFVDSRIRIHHLPNTNSLGYILNFWQLRKILKEIQPDLLHVHFASGYGTLGTLSGFHDRILSVWGSDVFLFPHRSIFFRLLLTLNLRTADWICSTSRTMRVETLKFLPENFKKITVVPFGVDLTEFTPRNYFQNPKEVIVGTVKALDTRYGIDILIRAFHFARKNIEPQAPELSARMKLVIAGGGSEEGALKTLVNNLGISANVVFLGRIPHSEVPKLLKTFSIFVAASRSESFGVSVIEASAIGLPVIVTNVGGLPEVVADNETGFVVPSENWQALGEKIVLLLKDPHLRERLGKNGTVYVQEHYEWRSNVKSMELVYQQVIGKAAARWAKKNQPTGSSG